jgi:hypothetical protein
MKIWKPIKNYENLYHVSNTGEIKNILTNKILKGYVRKGRSIPYRAVQLYNEKERSVFSIHTLVFDTFNGFNRIGYHIDHIDNDQENNHIDNLKLVNPRENYTKDKQYPGIYQVKRTKKWIARIKHNNKMIYLGTSPNKEDAFKIYIKAFERIEGIPFKHANA